MFDREMEKVSDKKTYERVIYIDLSKAFDTTNQIALIAKLNAYGFSCVWILKFIKITLKIVCKERK